MRPRCLFVFVFICLPLKSASLPAEKLLCSHPEVNLSNIKNIPDLYFEILIAQMSTKSGIPLFYNALVREYIEIYLMGRKEQIPELSRLSIKYFPIFETQLAKAGLPDELKYIPVIESALDSLAYSASGAFGLWQFKPETGRAFGLVIDGNSDERSDPSKSTQAACEYLKYLYGIFGDWQLSLLAYQAGPAAVKDAISKAGGVTSIAKISCFLPIPTQRYIPAFIAVMYVINNYKNHL